MPNHARGFPQGLWGWHMHGPAVGLLYSAGITTHRGFDVTVRIHTLAAAASAALRTEQPWALDRPQGLPVPSKRLLRCVPGPAISSQQPCALLCAPPPHSCAAPAQLHPPLPESPSCALLVTQSESRRAGPRSRPPHDEQRPGTCCPPSLSGSTPPSHLPHTFLISR